MNLLLQTIMYVTDVPFFWQSMGLITALSMFFGVAIFDGDIRTMKMALFSKMVYASLLFTVFTSRFIYITSQADYIGYMYKERTGANIITIVFVTGAWLLGIAIGVLIHRRKHKTHLCDKMEEDEET